MTAALAIRRATCRGCGGRQMMEVLDLGALRLSRFPTPTDPQPPPCVPLVLEQCETCSLVQLQHTTDPAQLYTEYWYRSGINETMIQELLDVVRAARQRVELRRGSLVLDIGANDGTLLRQYGDTGEETPMRIAVEPSATFHTDLVGAATEICPRFFPDADLIDEFRGAVKVITSIACFYDLDDPHAFLQGVADLLAPEGIWIVQFQDLAQMVAATAFDNLCHEHLTYLTLGDLIRLATPHGLAVVHAERRAINGGSLRVILQRGLARADDGTLAALLAAEGPSQHWETLSRFAWRVGQVAAQVRALVATAGQQGQAVDLYGASTKANTLLQVCGLGPDRIRQAWERAPAKWGRYTVTGIPIVSEAVGRAWPPALLLAGIWQFRQAMIRREAAYLTRGGSIVFPLPVAEVVQEGAVIDAD